MELVPPLDKLTLAKTSQQSNSQNKIGKKLVRVHGVTFRSVYDVMTDSMGWSVNECHWKLPHDLITLELISSIPIKELPCVLSHKWNGSQIYLYEGEIVHILCPDADIFLMQTVRGKLQAYNAYMSQVVACAKRSNFRYPTNLNFLIHQSTTSVARTLGHPHMDKEWLSISWLTLREGQVKNPP